MTFIRGEAPRSHWLAELLLLSLALKGADSPSVQPALCSMPCCSVLPTCGAQPRVKCDCPKTNMTIRKGDIPPAAHEVTILSARHVILEKGALPSLVDLNVRDVDQLEISQGVISSEIPTPPQRLSFNNIRSLKVEEKAFSGSWEKQLSKIKFEDIEHLFIEPNAFNMGLDELVMTSVRNLSLGPRGFSKPVKTVGLHDVSMDKCHQGSFGQDSNKVTWIDVTIKEVKQGCIVFSDGATFDAQGLKSDTVERKAFSGKADEVNIENSQLDHLHKEALNLRLKLMTLTNLTVVSMHPFSLDIRTNGPVNIEDVRIKKIQSASSELEGSEDFKNLMNETASDGVDYQGTLAEPKDVREPGNRPRGDHGLEEDVSATDNEDEDTPTKHDEEEQRPGHGAKDAIVSSNGADDRDGLEDRTHDDHVPTVDTKGNVPVRDNDDNDGHDSRSNTIADPCKCSEYKILCVFLFVIGVAVGAVLKAIWDWRRGKDKGTTDHPPEQVEWRPLRP